MTNATLIQVTPEELAALIAKEVARFAQSEPVWLTAPQLAARLGVSRQHIESLVHYGKFSLSNFDLVCDAVSNITSIEDLKSSTLWKVK